eukprot:GFUD01020392.1.p1 GENE.GFUD01020392.1~~GFUD01020392.1.p1  ORF type:complete len:239 (+),score=86.27 GFUD01020392.1:96-812(+)
MALEDVDWQALLENGENCPTKDITFFITDGDEAPVAITCHKLLLAIVSPVFKQMFFRDKSCEDLRSLDIAGVSSESFRKLIEFIYQNKNSFSFLGIGPNDLENMLTLSQRYQMKTLESTVKVAIMRSEGGANPCKNCEEERMSRVSVGYCQDCEEYLCQECTLAHGRVRCTKHHTIRHFSGGKGGTQLGVEEVLKCEKYFQPRGAEQWDQERQVASLQEEVGRLRQQLEQHRNALNEI